MSMSPLEALECRFSKSFPTRLSMFSLLSSSCSDLLMRRSPGSLCDGTWKLEKPLPSDGRFSEDEKLQNGKFFTAARFQSRHFSRPLCENPHLNITALIWKHHGVSCPFQQIP